MFVCSYMYQGFIQDFKLGGGNPSFLAPPVYTFSEVDSDAFWVEKKTGA